MYGACQNGFETTVGILLEQNCCLNDPKKFEDFKLQIEKEISAIQSSKNTGSLKNNYLKEPLLGITNVEVTGKEVSLCGDSNTEKCCFYTTIVNGWVGILSQLVEYKAG